MSTATETLSIEDDADAAPTPGPYLVLALDAARPSDGGSRYSLVGVREVEIGRGAARHARRSGGVLRIDVCDASLSTNHVRLQRDGNEWTAEDAGSKNGTFALGGERITRRVLADGDVFDASRTSFVFRDPGGQIDPGDLDVGMEGDALDSLDPQLAATFGTLARIARTGVSVLVLGETGTGKELVARAIHDQSARRGPYVPVNCGALPATLVESELFGSRRGAFSGAEDRPGLIRAADRGTLFLDEIGELPATSQVAFLRVLQEREVVPVGGHSAVKVDLRVIAATVEDLPALVALNRFRRDLYARLAGFTLHLPPLRRRKVDLGFLVGRVLARHADGRQRALDRPAMRALFAHDWPNNIRELDQALAAALAVSDAEVAAAHLPPEVRLGGRAAAQPTTPPQQPARGERASDGLDRDALEALFKEHRGNVSRVAEVLATSRSQVRRLAERFGLVAEAYRA